MLVICNKILKFSNSYLSLLPLFWPLSTDWILSVTSAMKSMINSYCKSQESHFCESIQFPVDAWGKVVVKTQNNLAMDWISKWDFVTSSQFFSYNFALLGFSLGCREMNLFTFNSIYWITIFKLEHYLLWEVEAWIVDWKLTRIRILLSFFSFFLVSLVCSRTTQKVAHERWE